MTQGIESSSNPTRGAEPETNREGGSASALIARLIERHDLTEAEAEHAFGALLSGGLEDMQTAAVLALLQSKGVTTHELTGAARAMRARVTAVPTETDPSRPLVDTCGTGGAPKTFNVSTAAALIAAAVRVQPGSVGGEPGVTGVRVAKHGNRSRTGRGSAEVLASLGVNIDAEPGCQAACLREAGVSFSFAVRHHPAIRHAMPARKALGVPTVFNLLGPLTNPAGASRQVLGVWSAAQVPLVAGALHALGAERAIVCHTEREGEPGLDELCTAGVMTLAHVSPAGVNTEHRSPESFYLSRAPIEHSAARDIDHAAEIVKMVLSGVPGPARDSAVLTAAAALVVGGVCSEIEDGLPLAASAIDSGAAIETLETLVRISNNP